MPLFSRRCGGSLRRRPEAAWGTTGEQSMKLNGWKVALVCVGLLGALGCGGVTIATPKHAGTADAALGEAKISSVTVTSSSALEGDKQELITKNDVPNKLQAALTESLRSGKHVDPAGTLKLNVDITEMRLPANP